MANETSHWYHLFFFFSFCQDNLNVFLKACEKEFGLSGSQLFHAGDLQDLSHRARWVLNLLGCLCTASFIAHLTIFKGLPQNDGQDSSFKMMDRPYLILLLESHSRAIGGQAVQRKFILSYIMDSYLIVLFTMHLKLHSYYVLQKYNGGKNNTFLIKFMSKVAWNPFLVKVAPSSWDDFGVNQKLKLEKDQYRQIPSAYRSLILV